jgi:N-acetylneuraminate synthase
MQRPLIVAELSINHLGMRKITIAMMQACQKMGVDYVKLKVKDVRTYYAKDGKKFNGYDFIEYRNSLELSSDDLRAIDCWCKDNSLRWFATAHDRRSLELLSAFDVPFFKVASMDAQNSRLLEEVLEVNAKKKPVIVSVGGLPMEAIRKIVDAVATAGVELTLLHTVAVYPTPPENCNVGQIANLRREFGHGDVRIGYSGHEEGYVPTLLAVQYGASMIERHLTLARDLHIHHIKAALTVSEFHSMIEDVGRVVQMMNIGDSVSFEEQFNFLRDRIYS